MPKLLQETTRISEKAAAEAKKSGRMLIQFISPGWGSSGYYSPEVLESAATDNVIPAGTHMYADHPTEEEDQARPVRSIKDLMAIAAEPARLATDEDVAEWGADVGALVGEVQVVPQWRDLIETVRGNIGTSIRGSATDIVEGEAEGRRGGIIEGLVAPVLSVDFVTRAGRGGKVLSVLESARATQRAVRRHGVDEATARDTEEALRTALRDTHGGAERTYIWVRDFDETTVWFEIDSPGDDAGLYGQTYTKTDAGAVTLTGTRVESRVVTTYVPATRSDSNTPTTEESEEDTMGNISIEESEHRRLTEAAGRVATLESERDTAVQERDTARGQLAEHDRRARATKLVTERAKEAGVEFTALETRGLLADLPLTDDGKLDEAAFTTSIDEDAAAKKVAGGAGTVSGFGGSTGGSGRPGEVSESDFDSIFSGSKGA